MKQWGFQLLISVCFFIIIFSQIGSLHEWDTLSTIRKWLYGSAICLWAIHLITFLTTRFIKG